jgi:hypothetical protein
MSIFTRFLGKSEPAQPGRDQLVANPEIENPLSLQLLFPEKIFLDPKQLTEAFRSYHPSMAKVRCEIEPTLNKEGTVFGLVGWGEHVVRCVGFSAPMPAEAVEACVAPSLYPQELKARARAHQAHLMLYYAGYEKSPMEQYVALAATAGVLARFGALVVLNEAARTSIPVVVLSGEGVQHDILDVIRNFPLPILFCGFVKLQLEDLSVWIRTFGASLLELPDFAVHARRNEDSKRWFDLFNNLYSYLRDSGALLSAGHTMQSGPGEFLRFRQPHSGEDFLDSKGELLVIEEISADEING